MLAAGAAAFSSLRLLRLRYWEGILEAAEELAIAGAIETPIVRPGFLGVEALGESQVTLRLLAKTEPLRQWDVARELRKRIKNAFDREGIYGPSPHSVAVRKAEAAAAQTAAPPPA